MTSTAPSLPLTARLNVPAHWLPIAAMLVIALVVRLPYIPINGSAGDYDVNLFWGNAFYEHNIGFYTVAQEVRALHPPLVPVINGISRAIVEIFGLRDFLTGIGFTDIVRIKLPSVVADLVLIAVVANWLRDEKRWLRFGIPLALALHPGLIANSVFWSQSDSIFTMFMVIALLLMMRGRPSAAWLVYTIAVLTKFQAIVLFPLMVILTLRRFPLRTAIRAPLIGAALFVVQFLLFASQSGFDIAMRPYLGAVDAFSATTVNAYNLWMVIEPAYWDGSVGVVGPYDTGPSWIAPLSFYQLGLVFFGVYLLVMFYIMWNRAKEPREFVWGAALYFGFFMLPTQMHERYLYPGIVLAILAIAQDRRMVIVAAVSAWTFTFNLIGGLGAPYYWWGNQLRWLLGNVPPRIALVNTLLLVEMLMIAVPRDPPRWLKWGVHAILAVVILIVLVVPPPTRELPADASPVTGVTMEGGGELFASRFLVEAQNFVVVLHWRANSAIYGNYVARVELEQEGELIASTTGSPQDYENGTWRWFRGMTYPLAYYLYPTTLKSGPISIYLSIKPVDSDTYILLDNPAYPGTQSERILIAVVPESSPPGMSS